MTFNAFYRKKISTADGQSYYENLKEDEIVR
jgi:hypothetical protein